MKVNVWQVGYTTREDWHNRTNPVCREMGYVTIPDDSEGWEEKVWNLLNWSCWNYNDEGTAVKPDEVHSPLDHCNSDIILQIENSNIYKYAKFIGFGESSSLKNAVAHIIDGNHLWPFSDIM